MTRARIVADRENLANEPHSQNYSACFSANGSLAFGSRNICSIHIFSFAKSSVHYSNLKIHTGLLLWIQGLFLGDEWQPKDNVDWLWSVRCKSTHPIGCHKRISLVIYLGWSKKGASWKPPDSDENSLQNRKSKVEPDVSSMWSVSYVDGRVTFPRNHKVWFAVVAASRECLSSASGFIHRYTRAVHF